MRRRGATRQEVESVVRNPIGKSIGKDGKPRYLGPAGDGLLWVVVAIDDPDCIITVFPKERG
jgi:hypothetical protein